MIAIPGAARSALVALLLGGLVGCAGGPDAAALQKDVESALQAKDFAGAVTKADAALQAEIGKVIVGHTAIVENTLIALLT